jgi:hypothetical protein
VARFQDHWQELTSKAAVSSSSILPTRRKKNLPIFFCWVHEQLHMVFFLQHSGESPHLRARLLQDGADGDVPLDQEDFTVPSVLQMLLTERAYGERRL